jgi:hypothetical protein
MEWRKKLCGCGEDSSKLWRREKRKIYGERLCENFIIMIIKKVCTRHINIVARKIFLSLLLINTN